MEYKCDECEIEINQTEWLGNRGLCDECQDEIN